MRVSVPLIALALMGCSGPSSPGASGLDEEVATPVAPAPVTAPAAPARRAEGPRRSIPAGTVLAGSRPGTPGRRPAREADLVPVTLAAFEIDRVPVRAPGAAMPLLASSRAEAESTCSARGGRLCSELEWERACEGEEHHPYLTGARLDLEGCTLDLSACTSSFGVSAMGIERPEWTASDLEPALVAVGASAVVRGASFDQALEFHRCDARGALAPVSEIGAAVRCCYGSGNEAPYPATTTHSAYRSAELDAAALRAILQTVPELAPYAADFRAHGIEDGDRALARGHATRDTLAGWELSEGPFFWSPTGGDEALVFSGHGGGSTVIAVLYRMPDGSYLHGASFALDGEEAPIAITHTPPSRTELHWTACQGCGGESGVIRLDEDQVIRVIQL